MHTWYPGNGGDDMNIIDLFAGAGGLSEGFRQAGFNIAYHIEMDYMASETLKVREAYYFLKSNNKLDIYFSYLKGEISKEELYSNIPYNILEKIINIEICDDTFLEITDKIGDLRVDGIIGGPPCQAYSIAGRSRSKDNMENDPRNYLFEYYIKFLKKYNPNFFVFENVVGILSAKKGEILSEIMKQFNNLGYNAEFRILNAKDFGVVQSRKRVIVVGWRKESLFYYPEIPSCLNRYTVKDLFDDLPSICAGEENNIYKNKVNKCLIDLEIRNENDILTYHRARTNNSRDLKIYKLAANLYKRKRQNIKYNALPNELLTHNNKKSFLDRFKVVPDNNISHTIVAHICKDGHHFIHFDSKQNRSLSVREAARIQSFPDNYYFENSQTNAFKQIGNAVPPLMAKRIAEQIYNHIITNNIRL